MATVVDARRRFYNLSRDDAKSDLAGYVIGRMALKGLFGESYMEAINTVEDYCRTVAEYYRLKHPTSPIPRAMNYFASRGQTLAEDPPRRQVDRVQERYGELCDVLAKADGIDRMWFHNAAFHDMEPPIPARDGIIRCIRLLRA